MQKSKKKPLIIILAGVFIIILVLIVVTIYKYRNPPLSLSNINKYLGDPSIILNVIITEQNTDMTIHLSDSVQIAEFCGIINNLSFEKDESIKNRAKEKYYLIVNTNTGYSIDTHLPRGYLLRSMKDTGIISPHFKVADMAVFDEWVKSIFEMEHE